MSISDSKSAFKSLTVVGSLLSLGSGLEILHSALSQVPAEALPPKAGAALTATVGILGAVLSILGRFKASKRLTFL